MTVTPTMRVAAAQLSPTVGDLAGNTGAIIEAIGWADDAGADLLVLPELAVTGYPPEDLLEDGQFLVDVSRHIDRIVEATAGRHVTTLVGAPWQASPSTRRDLDARPRNLWNAALVVADGRLEHVHAKLALPTYGVYDEARYFAPGPSAQPLLNIAGVNVGILICEDLWTLDRPGSRAVELVGQQPDVVAVLNASPFNVGKPQVRRELVTRFAGAAQCAVVYVNQVGGQDQLAFDGASMVASADGVLVATGVFAEADLFAVDLEVEARAASRPSAAMQAPRLRERPPLPARRLVPWGSDEEQTWRALVVAVRDYATKNGFADIVLGLSGGIDSAVAATLAVDALGQDHVVGITMPSPWSSAGSVGHSYELAANLGMRCETLPIGQLMGGVGQALEGLFVGTSPDVTEENVQARLRGLLLMAYSNKFGHLLLSASNRTESAVGYSTLYGDATGGYAPLSDVPKMLVYRLARWRNRTGTVIPVETIDKAPSAELAPGQRDDDSLPDYPTLDRLLDRYLEQGASTVQLVEDGFDPAVVERVVGLVQRAEYKRRQAPPGPKVTSRAFGRERRYPITNGWQATTPQPVRTEAVA